MRWLPSGVATALTPDKESEECSRRVICLIAAAAGRLSLRVGKKQTEGSSSSFVVGSKDIKQKAEESAGKLSDVFAAAAADFFPCGEPFLPRRG